MKPIIRYSKRKTLALSVNNDGDVVVKCPKHTCTRDIDSFLLKHRDWIIKQKMRVNDNKRKLYEIDFDSDKIDEYRKTALANFDILAKKWAETIGVKYKKVRLSNARTRWGSCSSKGILSINWRLVLGSDEIQSYVVLHEVMHLRHMNHSRIFWKDLEKYYADYKISMSNLKKLDYLLGL